MKTMTVGEFKTSFSQVISKVKTGEPVAVTFGKSKKIVGYFVAEIPDTKSKRIIGILDGKAKAIFHQNFKITEEEFLGL